jgi:hypothetical protein
VGVCARVLSLEVVDGEVVGCHTYAYHRATARSFWCGGSGHSSTMCSRPYRANELVTKRNPNDWCPDGECGCYPKKAYSKRAK